MSENIPALIAEARKLMADSEYGNRHDRTRMIESLVVALESLSAPSGDTERAELGGIIHRTVPDDESLAHLCEDDDCLWYDIADAVLAAGFRRVSPVTREAVMQILAENGFTPNGGHPHSWRCEHPDRYPGACRCVDEMTDDILALLSVSPPAEVEWEYGRRNRMTGGVRPLNGPPLPSWWNESQDEWEHVKSPKRPERLWIPVKGTK